MGSVLAGPTVGAKRCSRTDRFSNSWLAARSYVPWVYRLGGQDTGRPFRTVGGRKPRIDHDVGLWRGASRWCTPAARSTGCKRMDLLADVPGKRHRDVGGDELVVFGRKEASRGRRCQDIILEFRNPASRMRPPAPEPAKTWGRNTCPSRPPTSVPKKSTRGETSIRVRATLCSADLSAEARFHDMRLSLSHAWAGRRVIKHSRPVPFPGCVKVLAGRRWRSV